MIPLFLLLLFILEGSWVNTWERWSWSNLALSQTEGRTWAATWWQAHAMEGGTAFGAFFNMSGNLFFFLLPSLFHTSESDIPPDCCVLQ